MKLKTAMIVAMMMLVMLTVVMEKLCKNLSGSEST